LAGGADSKLGTATKDGLPPDLRCRAFRSQAYRVEAPTPTWAEDSF
jgi:hypothetical protein